MAEDSPFLSNAGALAALGGAGLGFATGGLNFDPGSAMTHAEILAAAKPGDVLMIGPSTNRLSELQKAPSKLKPGEVAGLVRKGREALGSSLTGFSVDPLLRFGRRARMTAMRAGDGKMHKLMGAIPYHGGMVLDGGWGTKDLLHITDRANKAQLAHTVKELANSLVLMRPTASNVDKAVEIGKGVKLYSSGAVPTAFDMDGGAIERIKSIALPDFIRRRLASKATCIPGKSVCTALPASIYEMSGSPISSVPGISTLPTDVLNSKSMQAVGHSGVDMSRLSQIKQSLTPRLIRAALWGPALYGAYRAGKFLYNSATE